MASNRAASEGHSDWPDFQLYLAGLDGVSCTPNLNRPRSRGRIYLNENATSLEESMMPIVDYNFFSDESDYEVMLEGNDQ